MLIVLDIEPPLRVNLNRVLGEIRCGENTLLLCRLYVARIKLDIVIRIVMIQYCGQAIEYDTQRKLPPTFRDVSRNR